MNTITAKELRDNLGEIAKRVSAGEQMRVSYRNKELFELRPIVAKKTEPTNSMPGLEALLKIPRKPSKLDPNKTIKQIYHEMLDEKYGRK